MRYWEFDHKSNDDGDADRLDVDTYNWDFEIFDTFCLNRNWDLEVAGGIRYNEFREEMFDPGDNAVRINASPAYGGLASAELRRLVGTSGAVFARVRGAILMDDKDVINAQGGTFFQQVRLLDVTVGMTEMAFGYDYVVPMADGAYALRSASRPNGRTGTTTPARSRTRRQRRRPSAARATWASEATASPSAWPASPKAVTKEWALVPADQSQKNVT